MDNFLRDQKDKVVISAENLLQQALLQCNCEEGSILIFKNDAYEILVQKKVFFSFQNIKDVLSNTTIYTNDVMLVPIMSGQRKLGAIFLASRSTPFNPNDMFNITPFVTVLKLWLQNNENYELIKNIYKDDNYLSKDLFFANLSHEIKTPLNGVVGYNQLLLKTALNPIQKQYVASMSQCSLQLLKIINDVLDLSRLLSKKMTVQMDCFEMEDIHVLVKNTTYQDLQSKRQKLQYTSTDDIPAFIIMDKQKLIQILINLVTNASKHSPHASVINIRAKLLESNMLCMEVSDTGVGIETIDQCKLFNSFSQISNGGGVGLGLAISKKLAELLGGKIWVNSEIGKGSTFGFSYKFTRTAQYKDTVLKRNASLLQDKYILLVDDNSDNRIIYADMLFAWDMKPIVCASALEALRMVLGNRYDFQLALVDICMPGTTGVELATQIHAERPLFPLIALSSIDMATEASTFFCACLQKPVNEIQLFNAIHTVISNNNVHHTYIGDHKPNESSSNNSRSSPCRKTIIVDKTIPILIAEDIAHNREMLSEMLSVLGYTDVAVVSNGKETIEALKVRWPKILLLDLRMPVIDGFGVLTYMRENHQDAPIDIVAVSASNTQDDKNQCSELGVNFYISKPIQLNTLNLVLSKIQENY